MCWCVCGMRGVCARADSTPFRVYIQKSLRVCRENARVTHAGFSACHTTNTTHTTRHQLHNNTNTHHTHHHHHHHPPPGAGHRVVVEGLSSQSVRPLWGLTGEARSRPGVTVAGGLGVCRGSVTSPMMGDTPSGVVARRTCPSRVGHLRVS